MTVTVTMAIACTSSKSRRSIAAINKLPSPGKPNTYSITTNPLTSQLMLMAMTVMVGSSAFRSTCRQMTVRQAMPFSAAVRT